MTEQAPAPSSGCARLAGGLYLGTILCGLYAELYARQSLIDSHDAAGTARAILSHQTLFRSGIVADLVMLACYIGVTILFHDMTRMAGRRLSQTAVVFSIVGIAVLAANTLILLAPLSVLAAPNGSAVAGRAGAAVALCLALHDAGYAIGLVFFGGYCCLLGWLFWRVGWLPKPVAALIGIAGLCYLVGSLSDLASPALARFLSPHIMDPTLIGESILALWLLIAGVRRPRVPPI